MVKKITALLMILLILFNFCGCASQPTTAGDDNTRQMTDLAGREVAVLVNPSRIAAMTGPSPRWCSCWEVMTGLP